MSGNQFEFEIENIAKASTEKRLRALRQYIKLLTVRPGDPMEVVQAVVYDLCYVFDAYGGSFAKACKDGTGSRTPASKS